MCMISVFVFVFPQKPTYTEDHCMYDKYGLINLKKNKKKTEACGNV